MGRLRIIAGRFRGRKLDVPNHPGVRPTSDRVREALFSILGAAVEDARVLDAYCGSGALGLEALSRGAASVTFIDVDPGAIDAVRTNAESLSAIGACRFHTGHVFSALERGGLGAPFDLVLADPPYGTRESGKLAARVASCGMLTSSGLVVVERDARTVLPDDEATGPDVVRTRIVRYGGTSLEFYRRAGATGASG